MEPPWGEERLEAASSMLQAYHRNATQGAGVDQLHQSHSSVLSASQQPTSGKTGHRAAGAGNLRPVIPFVILTTGLPWRMFQSRPSTTTLVECEAGMR